VGSITKIAIKLRFLETVSAENVDTSLIIRDTITYNRWKFWKIFGLIRFIRALTAEINEIRQMDFKDAGESVECIIKRPQNIDLIPFSAMIELQQYFGNTEGSKESIQDLVANVIALACYSENNEESYDSSSKQYAIFLQSVLDSDLIHMMGLYKWIEKAVTTSSSQWGDRFQEIQTIDKDYEAAGGSRMDQFNVLNTIKNSAIDFNVTYKEAMLLPYGMTQANSLSKATASHIQDLMSKIIETRMKQERAQK
jgi:hypothetical protein